MFAAALDIADRMSLVMDDGNFAGSVGVGCEASSVLDIARDDS
jgi:hypothetical protein